MNKMVDVTCYIVVNARINSGYLHGKPSVRISKNKPSINNTEVPIKINLQIPCELFSRPCIEANISLPAPASEVLSPVVKQNVMEAIQNAIGLNVTLTVIETPLAIATDIVTIGGALTEKNELYTVTALKKVIDNIEDATD